MTQEEKTKKLLQEDIKKRIRQLLARNKSSRGILKDKEWASDGTEFHKNCRRDLRGEIKDRVELIKEYRKMLKLVSEKL